MNYIKQLQAKNAALERRVALGLVEIEHFRTFLQSPKFVGEEGGERKDWIATGDVDRALILIREVITNELPIVSVVEAGDAPNLPEG